MSDVAMLFLLLINICTVLVSAYKIDASCGEAGIDEDVRRAMTSAFDMAGSAIAKLDENPRKQTTEELVRYLFTKNGQDPKQTRMQKVREILTRVRKFYRLEVTGSTEPHVSDIIIFCDLKRFQKLDDWGKDIWEDTSNGVVEHLKHFHCEGGDISNRLALAITSNPIRYNEDDSEDAATTQIQLCPWFVNWVKSKEFRLQDDVMLKSNLGRYFVKLANRNKVFADIDALNLLDKVLLHEMTHGRNIFYRDWDDADAGSSYSEPQRNEDGTEVAPLDHNVQMGLADVVYPAEGIFKLFWKWAKVPAYGWKRARELVEKGDVTGENNMIAPDNNADTLALFASACKLLDYEPPRWVSQDGSVLKG